MRTLKVAWEIFTTAIFQFVSDGAPQNSAALSFYTMLSLSPLLVLVLSVTTLFVSAESVEQELLSQMVALIGPRGAEAIQTVLVNARKSGELWSANILGIAFLIFGATAVFVQLQNALNRIWGVQPAPEKVWLSFLATRLLSFGMALTVGFLLLVSLIASAFLSALNNTVAVQLPMEVTLLRILEAVSSFVVITVLFALLFRFVPDVVVAWRELTVGALITALLFTIGKELIGYYLGRAAIASVYGAAGSLVVLLIWIYYTANVFFFGAEVAQAYARRFGTPIRPGRFAEMTKEREITA